MLGPEVMLATRSALPPDEAINGLMGQGGWLFEIKFDGIRAVVSRQNRGANVRITNRRRVDITHRYPDVVEAVSQMRFTGVLDGEIIVAGPDGLPSFQLAHLRDAQSRTSRINVLAAAHQATFVPFDVLEWAGRDMRPSPYTIRRGQLEAMVDKPPAVDDDGHSMWEFVRERGLEGIMAKRASSAYLAGRQRAWQKIKSTHRVSAVAHAIIPGRGSRGAVGAVTLVLWDEENLLWQSIGQAGSGISEADAARLQILVGRTPVVVEVEYLEVAPNGVLRNPVFKGIRDDIDPASCVLSVLQHG